MEIAQNPDIKRLLKELQPFEMDLPWKDGGFSSRFYEVVHFWGIPTKEEIAFLKEYINGSNARILDLACGGGRHSIGLAREGHHVTGIDIGWYPIKLAKKEAKSENLEIEYIQGDILRLNYENEFDLAFLICGQIGHFSPEENEKIFKNTASALKDRGRFIIHLFAFNNEDRLSFTHWYREKRPFYFPHPSVVHREQYYFKNDRIKLIRDFAVDTVTRENRLFGISEKNYTEEELCDFAEKAGLVLEDSFGGYNRQPLDNKSPDHIYVFAKK